LVDAVLEEVWEAPTEVGLLATSSFNAKLLAPLGSATDRAGIVILQVLPQPLRRPASKALANIRAGHGVGPCEGDAARRWRRADG